MRKAHLVFRLIEVAAKACRKELEQRLEPSEPTYEVQIHSYPTQASLYRAYDRFLARLP